MKITILCVGKIKEKFYRDAIDEYAKRLGRYCKISLVEVADEKTEENLNENQIEIITRKEGERILSQIRDDMYVIAMAIKGKSYDSVGLSEHLDRLMTQGQSHFCFVIGGSLGLSNEVLARADEKLSFSELTFPHQLMRVILLEQIYRSFRIMKNEPYHK